jgi:hypothetical protein
VSDNDWRVTNQSNYLTGSRFRWAVWWPYREGWDHDHCEFCFAEISDRLIDGHTEVNVAWVTLDDYRWVCPKCFEHFRHRFRWTVADAPM